MIEAYTLILSDQTALSAAVCKPLTWGWRGGGWAKNIVYKKAKVLCLFWFMSSQFSHSLQLLPPSTL